ncbi:MAG: hypothetical protein ACRYFX_01000 [Janthinobacterium lividum]
MQNAAHVLLYSPEVEHDAAHYQCPHSHAAPGLSLQHGSWAASTRASSGYTLTSGRQLND